MKLRTFATTLATAAALTLAAPAWAGYVFSFNVWPSPVYVDETVTVDVELTNDAAGLWYLGFDLLFDATILEFQSASGAGFFLDEDFFFSGATGSIAVLVSDLSLNSVYADGTVGTFTFKAIGVGSFDLNLDPATTYITDGDFSDHGAGFIEDIATNAVPVEVLPAATNGVPVPGTLLLAGLGLALLGGTRWRGSPLPAAR